MWLWDLVGGASPSPGFTQVKRGNLQPVLSPVPGTPGRLRQCQLLPSARDHPPAYPVDLRALEPDSRALGLGAEGLCLPPGPSGHLGGPTGEPRQGQVEPASALAHFPSQLFF